MLERLNNSEGKRMRKIIMILVTLAVAAFAVPAGATQGPALHQQSGLTIHAIKYGKHNSRSPVRRLATPVRISCKRMSSLPANVAPPNVAIALARAAFHYTCSHQTTWWYYNGWWHRLWNQGYDAYGHWHTYQIVAPGSSVSHWRTFYCTAA